MELKIKVRKRAIVTSLILLVILAAYNILYFVIPFNRTLSQTSYWITYGCTTFVVLFMAVLVFIGIGDKNKKSRVFGLPILYLGFMAIIIQLIFDIIVMVIGNWLEFKSWITIVFETLFLSVFFISLIVRTAYKDTIKKIDKLSTKENFIRDLRVDLEVLSSGVENDLLKEPLNKLFEKVKYTDPVSSKNVFDIEDEILNKIITLRAEIQDNQIEKALKTIKAIDSLITERKLKMRGNR